MGGLPFVAVLQQEVEEGRRLGIAIEPENIGVLYFLHELGLIPEGLDVELLSLVPGAAPVDPVEYFLLGYGLDGEDLKVEPIPAGVHFSETPLP